jgi:sugar lactone lactonase YvrE
MKSQSLICLLALSVTWGVSAAPNELVPVFQDNDHQFTGVAISTNSGRMFVTYPRWEDPHQYDLVEVFPRNTVLPFPSREWNSWKPGQDGSKKWVCVQAVWVDDQDNLWVVDPAAPKMEKVYRDSHKVVKINLKNNQVERIYPFKNTVGPDTYLNDIRVDTRRHTAYLTESKSGSLVVLDTDSGKARVVLQDHPSTKAESDAKLVFDGEELKRNGKPMQVQADSIALSREGDWLYYKALSGRKLYRVKTEALRNPQLPPAQLATKVEQVGSYSPTDGIIFDPTGNLYLSDLLNSAIPRITPSHQLEELAKNKSLIWPDSFAWDRQGWLYVTCSQIQHMAWSHNGKSTRTTPYTIFKLKPETDAKLTPTGRE